MPQLPLDVILRSRFSALAGQQLPLVEEPVAISENKRIGWCNRYADEAGLKLGMSESNAHALSSKLLTFPRDARQEQQALQEAALCALRFTPHVVLRSSGLLMEVGASLRLFKGRQVIASQLLADLCELGLQIRMAGSATATGAWWRAQWDALADIFDDNFQQSLDTLPIHVLNTMPAHLTTLEDIGCHTIGQLSKLPRTSLTRRFGKELLCELDRAYGKQAELHAWFEIPNNFNVKLELPSRVESTEAMMFATRRLLLQLAGWLSARLAAVSSITLLLHHEPTRSQGSDSSRLTITLGMPSLDIEHLSLLLRERLARFELKAPVIEITLQADQIVAQAAPNTELFPTLASDAESISRLVERLQNRLGADTVCQLSMLADHRPEKSMAMPALTGALTKRKAIKEQMPATSCVRPTWLLRQPLALTTRQDKPFYHSPLTLLVGPERIESGWWDDNLASRDYFIAQDEQHQLLWIFRVRTMQQIASSGWFLHGFFG